MKQKVIDPANSPNDKVAIPVPKTEQTNGGAAMITSAASAAIVEAVHLDSNGIASLNAKDCNKFVREVRPLIHTDLLIVDRL